MITAAVKDPSRFGKTIQERKFVVNFQKKEQDLDQVLQDITYQVLQALLPLHILLFLILTLIPDYHFILQF